MKKICIGISARLIDDNGVYIQKVPNNLIRLLKRFNVDVLIVPDSNSLVDLSIFSGFIIIGGKSYSKTDESIISYAINNDIPLIGICAGMQAIANYRYFKKRNSDHTIKIKNKLHYCKKKYAHKIMINNDSLLMSILGKKKIYVNSRHYYEIKEDDYFNIEAVSDDNVIEAITFKNRKLILGIQWHPEDLFDKSSLRIFKYFIFKCKN